MQFPIVMNWNLAEYLPAAGNVQTAFSAVVAGYISAIWSRIKNRERGPKTPSRRRNLGSQTQTPVTPLGVGALKSVEEFAKFLVGGEMSQKLFM